MDDQPKATEPPLVSVCVMTYNHERFIGKCLDSILEQETDFRFEICLGEDDSPDGTRDICRRYAEENPELVRLFLHSREDVVHVNGRPTAQGNFSNTMREARGKYMVLCDGDDFWCSPDKLQKQVDFLEDHDEYSGCFHRIMKVDEDGRTLIPDCGPPPGGLTRYSQSHFLSMGGIAPLFSVMFRNEYSTGLPDWFMKLEYVDLPLHFNNTQAGPYGYIDEIMGCYRIHGAGMANGSSRVRIVSMTIDAYEISGEHLDIQDQVAYSRGLRALKWSLHIEKWMVRLLPAGVKGHFDQGIGLKLRRFMRKMISRGADR